MIALMSHMIPFYPDRERSMQTALAMLEEGTDYLEIQFAFSDPSADGPVIEAACQEALRQGFNVDEGFAFIGELMEHSEELKSGKAKAFIMTYASIIYTRGIGEFCDRAAGLGVKGLIVPDLPMDSDEGLDKEAKRRGMVVIPVLAASSRDDRIALARKVAPDYIYCALRKGITGQKTELDAENLEFLRKAGSDGAKILAGFGISSRDQVEVLEGNAHAAIVGSAFLRALNDGYGGESGVAGVRKLVSELKGR